MHMGAEDTGVCQLHAITEDAVKTGFGTSSGEETIAQSVMLFKVNSIYDRIINSKNSIALTITQNILATAQQCIAT